MQYLLIILFSLLTLPHSKAQEDSTSGMLPGMLQSTERIVKRDQAFSKEWSTLPMLPAQVGAEVPLMINSFFLSSLLLNSSLAYLSFTWNNSCALIDLLWLNLLHDSKGSEIKFIVVDILQNDRTYKTYRIGREEFFKNAYRTRCPDSSRLAFQYGQKDLASVVKKIELKIPKDLVDCENILKELSSSAHAPYYCYFQKLYEEGKAAEANYKIKKRATESDKKKIAQERSLYEWLGPDKLSYLENFCHHAHEPSQFCQGFFQQNFFQFLAIKDTTRFLLTPECGTPQLSLNEAQSCATKLLQRPNYCFAPSDEIPSLGPRAACNEISEMLNLSRLSPNYRDCPGEVLEDSWITLSRIGFYFQRISQGKNFFKLSPEILSPWNGGSEYCSVNHYQHFYEFIQQEKLTDSWNFKICMKDPSNKKGICEPVFWKSPSDQFLPLLTTVQKLLAKKTGVYYKGKCEFVDQADYNPDLLKFRTGCFIVTEKSRCHLYDCPFTVFLDERDQRGFFQVSNGINFSSLPHSETKGKTVSQLFFERLKIQEKSIRSYTELMKFLKKYPNSLIHGYGCLEDLKPDQFPRNSLNQCTINSFILDGYKEGSGTISALFVLRTSLDEVYSPSYIDWKDLFSALKNMQNAQNQASLNLVGLYYE
ncbi:MAG: hypothetical protein QE271_06205 [Bacteriovoracaceae bacterium]|nr:hypothetical protein [Bacteriovoracaceae bacterium]